MRIRKAGRGDLDPINRIYNQAVEEKFCTAHLEPVPMAYSENWLHEHVQNGFPVFVAEEREKVLGWISLSPYRHGRQALNQVAEVSYYVDRDERRQGVGKQLLEKAIRVAPGMGITVLIAILLDRNTPSINLLIGYGFRKWGSMPGIARIGDQTADHLYYGLKL